MALICLFSEVGRVGKYTYVNKFSQKEEASFRKLTKARELRHHEERLGLRDEIDQLNRLLARQKLVSEREKVAVRMLMSPKSFPSVAQPLPRLAAGVFLARSRSCARGLDSGARPREAGVG